MKDYDYLGIVMQCTDQGLYCKEDEELYEKICSLWDDRKVEEIYDILSEWDYFESCGNTTKELDQYDEVIFENEYHILTHVSPIHWGTDHHAFFLYRKIKED